MKTYRSGAIVVVVVLLVVVAGCSARPAAPASGTQTPAGTQPTDGPHHTNGPQPTDGIRTPTGTRSTGGDGSRSTATATQRQVRPPDPDGDVLGWENGYWYNGTIAVDGDDGYDRGELNVVITRMMARLERLRGAEFTENVSVEIITRSEYRRRNVFEFEPNPARDQFWEALFVVGEDRDAATVLNEVYGGNVAGYYSGGNIVVVSEDEESVAVDRSTLVHELVHALQDQQFEGGGGGDTYDSRLAARAVSEGEANYLMDRYAEQCNTGWSCITQPQRRVGSGSTNQGVFLSIYSPYSDGPTLIGALVERAGWAAVDEAWTDRPVSTEQVIHPENYPEEKPVDVYVDDRSGPEWNPFTREETVGEATLFGMFVYNGVIPESHLRTDSRRYNYSHPITAGWRGDSLVRYRDDDRFGYVFETAWDTHRDARQFADGYRELLEQKGARKVRNNVYRISSGPYADAFRVVRSDKRVRIVNAPTVEALDEIHPSD